MKQPLRKRRRGIVLMIAFVTLIMITMLVGAAFTLLPSQLLASQGEAESSQALAAAASGADYAQSRLQNRPTWKGDLDGTGSMAGYVVNTPSLQIYEDKGNVLGLMTQPDGDKTAFRIRFNFQNGGSTSPDDGFNQNPAATHVINIPQVSFNNLGGWAAQPIYSATNVSGTLTVSSSSSSESLPKFESAVYVEGLAGPALRDATIDTLDSFARKRGVLSQLTQARIGFLSQSRVDSAIYAGGDFTSNSTLAAAVVTNAPGASAAHLRSLKSFQTGAGTTLTGTNAQSRAYYSTAAPGGGVTITSQAQSAAAQNSRWLKLKWSEIPKASPSAATRLKAGTFYWQKNATTGNPELLHYPEEYSGTGAFVPTSSPTVVSNAADMMTSVGPGVSLDLNTMTTTITDTVYVDPIGAVKGISVLIDPAYQATLPMRPQVILDPDPNKTCLVSTTGSMFVQGNIEGVGSITTEGNLKIQGTSLFEADTGDSVVLYSKGDINVESIPPSVAAALAPANTYKPGMGNGKAKGWRNKGNGTSDPATVEDGDVSFAGAVFAMGNFKTQINNGGLYIRGILSAYGGDPSTQDPGSVIGSGLIDVNAHRIEFMYDPSYLMNSGNTGKPSYLDRISWNLQN